METNGKLYLYDCVKVKDLTSNEYLHFKVLSYGGFGKKHIRKWICECECGKKFIATSTEINTKLIVSCGCIKKDDMELIKQNYWDEVDDTRISIVSKSDPNKNNHSDHRGIYLDNHGTWYAKLVFRGVTYRVRFNSLLNPLCIIFLALVFIGMAIMVVFAIKLDSSNPKSNWIEQICNGLSQACFFIGFLMAYLLK